MKKDMEMKVNCWKRCVIEGLKLRSKGQIREKE
jgi:hypothetical protein